MYQTYTDINTGGNYINITQIDTYGLGQHFLQKHHEKTVLCLYIYLMQMKVKKVSSEKLH